MTIGPLAVDQSKSLIVALRQTQRTRSQQLALLFCEDCVLPKRQYTSSHWLIGVTELSKIESRNDFGLVTASSGSLQPTHQLDIGFPQEDSPIPLDLEIVFLP
jgi:hypothetical protein